MKHYLLYIVLMFPFILLGYPWPIPPGDSVCQINSTLGEPRPPNPPYYRFHQGVDINATKGTPVISVSNNIVDTIIDISRWENGVWVEQYRVRIGDFSYVHIDTMDTMIWIGKYVSIGDTIGKIASLKHPHLHFEELRGLRNPLRDGGLDDFVDNTPPVIAEGSIRFWRQGTDSMLNPNDLSGKVDIRNNADTVEIPVIIDNDPSWIWYIYWIWRYEFRLIFTDEINLFVDTLVIELNNLMIGLGGAPC